MKAGFEIPVSEGRGREGVVRVNIPAALAGEAAFFLGSKQLAGNEMLPDAFTHEILGETINGVESLQYERIVVERNGEANVSQLALLTSAEEKQLGTFLMPINKEALHKTAEQLHENVTEFLSDHPLGRDHTARIEIAVLDETIEVNPLRQLHFMSETKIADTLTSEERRSDGNAFEAYGYVPGNQADTQELTQLGINLESEARSLFEEVEVDQTAIADQTVPFTVRQYESLARLAQKNGYPEVTSFLESVYGQAHELDDQIDAVFNEVGVLSDQPSVLVTIIEQLHEEDSVSIDGCQLQTQVVTESYHRKEYDADLLPIGILSAIGCVVGGIRYHRRRKVLASERLMRAGLDGPAPSQEVFEAVKAGTADTRQKLMFLRYQQAMELQGDRGKRLYPRRLLLTGGGIVLAGLMAVITASAASGDKPDEKPPEASPVTIVDISDVCKESNMIAIKRAEKGPTESVKYFADDFKPAPTRIGTPKG